MITVRDPLELLQALRARAEVLDISREALDDLAGLAKGHSSKLLATPPIKGIGPVTLFPLAGALGYSIALIEDVQRVTRARRMASTGYKRRPFAQEWRNSKALAIMLEMAKTYGRIGATERMKKTTPEQRSAISRKNIKKRWRRPRIIEVIHAPGTSPAAAPPSGSQPDRQKRNGARSVATRPATAQPRKASARAASKPR